MSAFKQHANSSPQKASSADVPAPSESLRLELDALRAMLGLASKKAQPQAKEDEPGQNSD